MAYYPKEQMTYQEVVVPTSTQSAGAYSPTSNMGYGTDAYNPVVGGTAVEPGYQTSSAAEGFGRQEMARQFRGQETPKWVIPAIVIGGILGILLLIGLIYIVVTDTEGPRKYKPQQKKKKCWDSARFETYYAYDCYRM